MGMGGRRAEGALGTRQGEIHFPGRQQNPGLVLSQPKPGVKQPSGEGGMLRALPTARGMDDLSNTIPV